MSKKDDSKRDQCRVVAGKWRGRIIRFEDAEGLRPTTGRIRETVFNWLQPYLLKSVCLDCFAGSGILGFEAISRGAADVVFVEKHGATAKNIKASVDLLKADNASVVHADVLSWLQSAKTAASYHKVFDLVFLDPPFRSGLLAKSSALLVSSGCLAEDAIIYVEHAVDEDVVLPDNWTCIKEKKAGQVHYQLYLHQASKNE